MKLPYIVTRMWDLSFVAAVGLLILALTFAEDHAALLAIALAYNAGLAFCSWIDRFHFDAMVLAAKSLAQVCDRQQTHIGELYAELERFKSTVDGIVGKNST